MPIGSRTEASWSLTSRQTCCHEQTELSLGSESGGSHSAPSWTDLRGALLSHCDKHLHHARGGFGLRGYEGAVARGRGCAVILAAECAYYLARVLPSGRAATLQD